MEFENKKLRDVADVAARIMMGEKALHPNQQKLDVHEPEKDELTAKDFELLRKGKKAEVKKEEVEQIEECIDDYCNKEKQNLDKKDWLIRCGVSYYLMIASLTGLRTGEQKQLKWGDLIFSTDTINKVQVSSIQITVVGNHARHRLKLGYSAVCCKMTSMLQLRLFVCLVLTGVVLNLKASQML